MKKKIKCMSKKKSRLLLLSCLVISPVPTIHTAAPQTDELFFLLLTSQACTSPLSRFLASLFKSLFSYTVPLGSDVWACPSARCAFSASVRDMRGRALKHSPSPRWVHRFAEAGRKDVRRSMMRCGNLHVLSPHPFIIVDNSPITWVTSRYWLQRWTYTHVWQDSN